jgi:predicted Rossmann fold nucleotide-binding protein DprA/Smf involved in DNA uptake
MKIVAVVGSRRRTSFAALARRLAELEPAEVVSGRATGVDHLAAEAWAKNPEVP